MGCVCNSVVYKLLCASFFSSLIIFTDFIPGCITQAHYLDDQALFYVQFMFRHLSVLLVDSMVLPAAL